eukprot:3261910-Amphidinium_carterae.1
MPRYVRQWADAIPVTKPHVGVFVQLRGRQSGSHDSRVWKAPMFDTKRRVGPLRQDLTDWGWWRTLPDIESKWQEWSAAAARYLAVEEAPALKRPSSLRRGNEPRRAVRSVGGCFEGCINM